MESWVCRGGAGALLGAPCSHCDDGFILSGPWECPECQLVIAVLLEFAVDRDGGQMVCPNCQRASRIEVDELAAAGVLGHA